VVQQEFDLECWKWQQNLFILERCLGGGTTLKVACLRIYSISIEKKSKKSRQDQN